MHVCRHSCADSPDPGLPVGREKDLLELLADSLDLPQARIEQVAVGPNLVGVLADGRMGLASHLGARPSDEEKSLPQRLKGQTCAQAARLIMESRAYPLAIGVAALNAGLTPRAVSETLPIQELAAAIAGDGEAALVGQFPFTPWLRQNVGKLHLFELQKVEGRVPRDQWDEVLARVQVAVITSTVFLTRHADYYLGQAKNAVRILVGPSTPMSPRLFEWGVDILAGSRVTDPEKVLHSIRQGGCFSDVVKAGGIEFVQMRRPGLEL